MPSRGERTISPWCDEMMLPSRSGLIQSSAAILITMIIFDLPCMVPVVGIAMVRPSCILSGQISHHRARPRGSRVQIERSSMRLKMSTGLIVQPTEGGPEHKASAGPRGVQKRRLSSHEASCFTVQPIHFAKMAATWNLANSTHRSDRIEIRRGK